MSDIRDIALAPEGQKKIDWARAHMPLLAAIEKLYIGEQPLKGFRVSLSVHMEAKTARLAILLKDLGAEVRATGSNILSTQDDVAAALASNGVEVFAIWNASPTQYTEHLIEALSHHPHVVVDDGGDFTHLLHTTHKHLADSVTGGCEETTTGVQRLRARAKAGILDYPMISVNDAECKHLFDNRYGTGQSVWDAIMHNTNLIVAGKIVVVAGYGWCGKGVAHKARALGAQVIVTEVNPVKAIEAVMDGYEVMPMSDAACRGDIFITVTGCKDVITASHFLAMRDGAMLSNAGHFDVEVAVSALKELSVNQYKARENIDAYVLPNDKTLYLLAEGRLVNLAGGNGHPVEIMDMSFALQALSSIYISKQGKSLQPGIYDVPPEVDSKVAEMKLSSMGKQIDILSIEQSEYIHGWEA